MVLLAQPVWHGETHEVTEMAGFGLVLLCVAGRMWSILYVGSRKNRELVTSGPYSMTMNPLYFFSTTGAVGIGLIYGSFLVAVVSGLVAYGIFLVTAAKEAEYLRSVFGPRYDAYADRTPTFWPDLSLYHDAAQVLFSPAALRRTFLDCLYFVAAFPLIEFLEYIHDMGYLPILLTVY
jgi:protein-S-isoprenylcysteine O-methyltransferase Ste14